MHAWASVARRRPLEDSIPAPRAAALYASRRDAADVQRVATDRQWKRIGNLRLALFTALAVLVGWTLIDAAAWKWIAIAGLLILLVVIIPWHARRRRTRDDHATRMSINELALARLSLDWNRLPAAPGNDPDRTHPYAWDLDVVGHASLLQRISTPVLHDGWVTLRQWLTAAPITDDLIQRQEAVRELALDLDLRQRVETAGRRTESAPADPAPFLAWTAEPDWLLARPWLWILAIVSPLMLVVTLAIWLAGSIAFPLWIVPIVVNVALFQLFGGRISGAAARVTPLNDAMRGYATIVEAIAGSQPQVALLRHIVSRLDNDGASGALRRFARIASFAMPRASLLWMPAQMALLWDVHSLHALERWRRGTRQHASAWFAAAGEWEAIAALSVLAHDHPDWAFPTVDSDAPAFEAHGLAHPLIAAPEAVANDVTVGPSGTFLFVTGSNMSGKSTLLRAVGANAVLAMAGAPVAATRLAMPPVDIWTCMRVEDSLERGVSFFMAELQRLKAVVDAATGSTDRPVLYLLDEILQGTNTAERQIASRQVMSRLCRAPAIGAISSHDLELVADPRITDRAVAVHFAETVTNSASGAAMTFDYRIKPGRATSTNALALMRMLGFEIDEDVRPVT